MAKTQNSIWALLLIAVIAIGLGVVAQQRQSAPVELRKAILLPNPKPLPTTQFTTHTGAAFQSDDFKGKWHVLFFGFTHCPDICPTTLYSLKQTVEKLEQAGAASLLQVSMITVDPVRDTPERLAQYVPFFHPSFMGLTAEQSQLQAFARQLGVLYIEREPDAYGNYDVDHSAALILLNPEAEYAGAITAPHKVDDLVYDLTTIMGSQSESNPSLALPQMADSLTASTAWVRPAPPGASALAGYLQLTNAGDHDAVLIGASSPTFAEVMIHTTSIEDGVASMAHLEQWAIASNSTSELSPLGTHLMLINPSNDLQLGQVIPITLEFEDGSTLSTLFEVKHPSE